MKKIKIIIALILIQTFTVSGVVYSWPSILSDTLSPQLNVQTSQIQNLFSFNSSSQFLSKDRYSISTQVVSEYADNLDDAYKELDNLLRNKLKTTNTSLLICIDGDKSTGKSTFADLIRKKAIAGISRQDIAFIDLDELKNDEYQENHSYFDVMINLPFLLIHRIEIAKNKKLVIVVGRYSEAYLTDIMCIPEITVMLRASTKVKLKRHIMRYGLLGIKFFLEDRFYEYIPKGTISLIVTTNQPVPLYKFLPLVFIKTITQTLQYIMPEFALDFFSEQQALFKAGLKGDVEFVKRFQLFLLSKKGMSATVQGININASQMAMAMHWGHKEVTSLDVGVGVLLESERIGFKSEELLIINHQVASRALDFSAVLVFQAI